MNKKIQIVLIVTLVLATLFVSCKKDENNPVTPNVPTYPVSLVVKNPAGVPQGGALVMLKNPPFQDPKFQSYTDNMGQATIQSPEGLQTIVAKMGSVFQAEIQVTVAASQTPTNAGTVQLQQNTSFKVLVVKANCEMLENVLRDPKIGFNTFDTAYVTALRDSAAVDSTKLLNFLRQYTLIFSDCNCGDEYGYPVLARVYGRYIQGGGKIYGGHYNYYNLQFIWPTYYDSADHQFSFDHTQDTILITDANLQVSLGFSESKWDSTHDTRNLSGYEKWLDLPPGAKTYGTIKNTNPSVSVIVENYMGNGKFLWTDYHNQDVIDNSRLIKIVRYFLYSL